MPRKRSNKSQKAPRSARDIQKPVSDREKSYDSDLQKDESKRHGTQASVSKNEHSDPKSSQQESARVQKKKPDHKARFRKRTFDHLENNNKIVSSHWVARDYSGPRPQRCKTGPAPLV